jgi:HlyD family secretion protein
MAGAGLVVAAAVAAGVFWSSQPDTDSALIQVNGRIEGDQIVVSARVPARISELLVREGDAVQSGQVMLKLHDDAVAARAAQAKSAADAQMAQVRAIESSLSLLRSETAMLTQTAQAEVSAAQAELTRLGAVAQQSALERDRVKQLADQGFLGPQALERAQVATKSAMEQYNSARAQVQKAQVNLQNTRLAPQRIESRSAELQAAIAQAEMTQAKALEAASESKELTVTAPVNGHVVARYINPGEAVNHGVPLYAITDLTKVYLKAYIPEPMLGRVQLGQAAQIWTDSTPDQPIDAKVGYIANRAEFTPKEVQTRDERTKLVFEVRLYPTQTSQLKLRPGQPADGMIRLSPDTAWHAPRH